MYIYKFILTFKCLCKSSGINDRVKFTLKVYSMQIVLITYGHLLNNMITVT